MIPKTIELHRKRIEQIGNRPDIYFDQEAADSVIRFIENNLKLTGDWNGRPFTLMDWEKYDLIYPIFGLKYKDSDFRVIRMAYIQLARGLGKSAFNASMLIYYLLFGGKGIDLYCVGSTKTTASNVFVDCVDIYQNSPALHPYIDSRGNEFITELYTTSKPRNTLQVIAADARFQGPRPACTSYDEYHVAPHGKLFETFRQSQMKLRESLMLVITNAGDNLNSACYGEYQLAKKILTGALTNDSYLAYIPEPDEGDKWDDIETAKKVNIGLGITVMESDLIAELETAKAIPAKKPPYIQYRLNKWNMGGGSTWVPYDQYEKCIDEYDESDLYGLPIWLGVDKAATRDLTSISGIIPLKGVPHVLTWNFRPLDKLVNIQGEAPYSDWLDQGYIFSGGENIVLSSVLFDYIKSINENFNIQCIGFDRAMAGDLMQMCKDENINIYEIPQGKTVFTDPINKHEELIMTGGIRYPNNPCLNWQFSNAQIYQDSNGLKKFVREHKASNKRNDAVLAITQAIYIWGKSNTVSEITESECYAGYSKLAQSKHSGLL